jgi:hypothetical protein
MKWILLATIALVGCTSPTASGVKVIVGAKLVNPGREPIDYSVVVIEGKMITAAGTQASTPVPKGSVITRGMGMTLQPSPTGGAIEAGRPADLILQSATERKVMRDGEWLPPGS